VTDLSAKNREREAGPFLDWSKPPAKAALTKKAREIIRSGIDAYGLRHADLADCQPWALPTRARVARIAPADGLPAGRWREAVGSRVKRVMERGDLEQLRDVVALVMGSVGRATWVAEHPGEADPVVEAYAVDRFAFWVWPGYEQLRNTLTRTYSDGQRDPAAVILPWEVDNFSERVAQHIVKNAPGFQRSKKKRGVEIAGVIRDYLAQNNLSLAYNWACSVVDPKGQLVGRIANRGNADRALGLYLEIMDPVVRALGVWGGVEDDFSLEAVFRACAKAALHPDGLPEVEGRFDEPGDDYSPTPTSAEMQGSADRYNAARTLEPPRTRIAT
jgi:hypothetical protein